MANGIWTPYDISPKGDGMTDNIDAPGLSSRRNKDGSLRWYWLASRAAKAMGYKPTSVRLHGPGGAPIDLSDSLHRDHVKSLCLRLQTEMLSALGDTRNKVFDGTLGALLDKYECDKDSPFHDLKEKTRRGYLKDMNRLRKAGGSKQLSEIKRSDLKAIYDAARKPKSPGDPERIRSARGLMIMLKVVTGYGATEEIPHCQRIRNILGAMRFKSPKPRSLRPTYKQARAVFEAARDAGCFSIALGSALQFEGMLRQYDVTGIWETLVPGEEAAIVLNGRRWSGITWGNIGQDGVLRWETPKRDRYIEIDLSLYPMITEGIGLIPPEKRVGPIIIDERSGLPYSEGGYMKRWREFADLARLPKEIWNRDFRAGGVTEGHAAGASIEDVSKHAAHSDPSFTSRVYDRDTLEAARRVATARVAHRNKR